MRCDPLGEGRCLLPWPNDYLTRPDPSTPTGRRLALRPTRCRATRRARRSRPADYNASDGFSPGQTIVVKVPGLDTPAGLRAHRRGPADRPGPDLRPPISPSSSSTPGRGARQLDLGRARLERRHAREHRAAHPPGRQLARGPPLRRRAARPARRRRAPAAAGPAFRGYRDRLQDPLAALEARRRHMERSSARCAGPGIERDDALPGLGLHRRQRSARSPADAVDPRPRVRRARGPRPRRPARRRRRAGVPIDSVTDCTARRAAARGPPRRGPRHRPVLPRPARLPPGSRFQPRADGLPVRLPGNTTQASFICNIPRSATPGAPARPSLYGHGLFGDAGEVGADNVEQLGNEQDVLVCASDWIGMAEEDVPNALTALRTSRASPRCPTASSRASSTPVPRTGADPPATGLAPTRPSAATGRRSSTPGGSSTTATARAASPAARSPRWRRTSRVRALRRGHELQPARERSVDFDPFGAVLDAALPRPAGAAADPLAAADPVGPRRAQRVRAAPHARPAAGHAAPPVLQLSRSATTRWPNVATEVEARTIGSQRPHAGARPGAQPRPRPLTASRACATVPRNASEPRRVGHRPAAAARTRATPTRPPARRQTPAADRRRPARPRDRVRGPRARADREVAAARRAPRRRLRHGAVPRGRLEGPS